MEIIHSVTLKTIIDETKISTDMLALIVNMDAKVRKEFFSKMATELFIENDLLSELNEGNSWALLEVVK